MVDGSRARLGESECEFVGVARFGYICLGS